MSAPSQPDSPLQPDSPSRARRRRTRTKPGALLGPWLHQIPSERLALFSLAFLLFGSVLSLGTVHVPTLLVLTAAGGLAAGLALLQRQFLWTPAGLLALGLALFNLLQALPLPLSWLSVLSPQASAIWASVSSPWEGSPPRFASLSLEPGASLVEALRFCLYALVFSFAAQVGRQRGLLFLLQLVFASACTVAAIALLHGLSHARLVYGLYDPSFTPGRWTLSPLINPNNLSGYLNLGIFAGIGLLWQSREARTRWLSGLGVALLIGQSFLSASRGGVFSMLLGQLALLILYPLAQRSARFWKRRRPRRIHWPVFLTLGAGLGLGLLGAQQATWEGLQEESLEKLSVVQWSLPLLRDFAFTGIGAGAFETVFPAYRVTSETVLWAHPENFILGWLCSWGLIVGSLALLGFTWIFRPSRLGTFQSVAAACATLGAGVFLVQNLADLAFDVPGALVGLVALLGGLWGAQQGGAPTGGAQPDTGSPSSRRARAASTQVELPSSSRALPTRVTAPQSLFSPRLRLFASLLFVLVGLSSWFGSAWLGRHTGYLDRQRLEQLYYRTPFQVADQRELFSTQLQAALLRHPADPYLPRLGALASLASRQNPFPWLARTLEREPRQGAAHLLLAEVLQERGAHSQALLHLRWAAQYQISLAGRAAQLAVQWTSDPAELRRIIPPTPPEAVTVLLGLAHQLSAIEIREQRAAFLQEALQLDPTNAQVRAALLNDLIRDLKAPHPPCDSQREHCLAQAEQHLQVLRAHPSKQVDEVQLTGRYLEAADRVEEALSYLDQHCQRKQPHCLRTLIQLSAQHDHDFTDAVQSYLALSCVQQKSCVAARLWVGDLYARKKQWHLAHGHYRSAAEVFSAPEAWLRVAEAAKHLGSRSQMLDAWQRALRSQEKPDPQLKARIEELKRQMLLE